jgi:lactaldehyde dehydrogenase/glycolaldehyde dehydrogenase
MSDTSTLSPLLLGGTWATGSSDEVLDVENPATGGLAGRVAQAGLDDVDVAVRRAQAAQPGWARRTVAERAAVLVRLAELLERDREQLAAVITRELGKPITESRGEVGGAAGFCRYFAAAIVTGGGEVLPSTAENREIWVRREPVGVVAGIIPWNYPLALTARKVAPALAAGNAIVLKPSELTPLSALAFARLAEEAGVDSGLLSVLPGSGAVLGPALVSHPGIGFVTMTGSVRAGRSILGNAAARVLPVSLELGGKAPFIVFDDADLDDAVDAAVAMRMMNNGQACVCNERTYVHESVFDEFVARASARVAALAVGDPFDESTEIGPKASAGELDNVERIVQSSLAQGARAVTGGRRLTEGVFSAGHWFEPTVLVDAAASSPALREEIFGPVLPVTPFSSEQQVVGLANDTEFGLSSYLYTQDFSRAMRLTKALRSGEVFVNRLGPEEVNGFHGGWGLSGLGGDDGRHGLELFQQKKTVYVQWEGSAER